MTSDYFPSVNIAPKLGNEVSALIKTILERCKKEKDNGCLFVALDDYLERVSYYTAYPKTLIQELTGMADTREKQLNLDGHRLLLISMKMLLKLKVPPTLTTVYNMCKQNKECLGTSNKAIISTPSQFCSQINNMKYEFKKTASDYLIIVENPKITFERYHFLSRIRDLRNENKNIYYIDEKIVNASLSYKKPTVDRKHNEDEEYAFFLMMSSNGYEHGLFTSRISEEIYKRWIENIIMPLLKPCSTVILTNSYIHGSDKNPITSYHTKTEMMDWLRDNGIPYSSDMHRAELYNLIEKCTLKTQGRNIDRLFKSYGHEVLHLPSTFEEISPIEFLWEHIKSQEFLLRNENVYIAKNKLYTYISTLSDTVWQNFMLKCKNVEEEIFDLDTQIEAEYDTACKFDERFDLENPCICHFHHSLLAGDIKF